MMFEEQGLKTKTLRCPKCKDFYTFEEGFPPSACPECMTKREAQTRRLRELISKNKGINAMELARRTNIPINFIMKTLNEGEIAIKKTEENIEQLVKKNSKRSKKTSLLHD
jgi:hypothetical protein